MPTEVEELQVREFLKRAEIKTMKKDLRGLREVDALKERDKIATIKTLEEQRLEHEKKIREKEEAAIALEKIKREKVLSENAAQERLAEKDLKEYATEEERQQIFLFESQRLAFEKKIEEIDTQKDPALKLQKNQILLQKQELQSKLNAVEDEEKKMETEQSFIIEKSQTSVIASEKKSLEERRAELEKSIQDVEKRRWMVEGEIKKIEEKISDIDDAAKDLVAEKNDLNQKILGVDKSLRDIYSGVVERVQQQKAARLEERQKAQGAVAEIRLKEKEEVQRQQWRPTAPKKQDVKKEEFAANIVAPGATPVVPIKRKINISEEEIQRKKFLEDVERWTKEKEQQENKIQQNSKDMTPPVVPVPPKKN
jgi:hypothetical protein